MRRGPTAFNSLVSSLMESGHQRLAYLLQGKTIPENENNNYKIDDETNNYRDNDTNKKKIHPFILPANQKPQHIRQVSLEQPNVNINLSTEPLKVEVKKSVNFHDNRNASKVPVYSMRSKNRGIFLCINNIEFVNDVHDRRNGAEADEENLKDLFKQIGFQVQSHRNQSKRDMKDTVIKFVSDENKLRNADCAVIAVMSHGEEGETKDSSVIITSDGQRVEVCQD